MVESANSAATSIPHIDATVQTEITDEQATFFLENGFLVIGSLLRGEELIRVQEAMMSLVQQGADNVGVDQDFMYGEGQKSGTPVLRRIEYVIDKRDDPMKSLLGHPFILRSVGKLQGPNFIPTWDSMVIKMPDEGVIVPWHRDAAYPDSDSPHSPIFNVDFYLDDADLKSCLWVIPGSNRWSAERAAERIGRPGFETADAIAVPLEAGDVIFHDIGVLHGSPAGDGNDLRRTVYYEFRPAEMERDFGPHTAEYIGLKQQVLLACIDARREAPYAQDETPFEYSPSGAFALQERVAPTTYRYSHAEYRR